MPSDLDSATQDADDTQTEMTKLQHRKDSIYHQVVEQVRNQEEMSKELEKMTNEIQQFQKYLAYLQLIQEVEQIR